MIKARPAMRPLLLKLAASALLAVAAMLVPRPPGQSPATPPRAPAESMPARRGGAPAASSRHQERTRPAARAAGTAPAPASPATTSVPAGDAVSSEIGRAVQLAESVPLPAALMTWDAMNGGHPAAVSPAVAGVTREIGNTFYQQLAASPAALSPLASPADPVTANGHEDTTVMGPSPAVEQARAIANETYRVMFGDQAYNQQTLNSAREVRLPVAAAGGHP